MSTPESAAPEPVDTGPAAFVGLLLIGIVVVFVLWVFTKPDAGSAEPNTRLDARYACTMSEEFVLRQLRSPATADFPGYGSGCTAIVIAPGRYEVNSYVDSENGFGAMLRSHYSVVMVGTFDSPTWLAEDLEITTR